MRGTKNRYPRHSSTPGNVIVTRNTDEPPSYFHASLVHVMVKVSPPAPGANLANTPIALLDARLRQRMTNMSKSPLMFNPLVRV